ncbi:hypothetical protein [Brevibacillus daliensis]|uniref:hypothetical protein n=1 Tax=Brevibacillus daliensis TaxID=2892995 RepID=UPI001E5509D3|nr:hypothetical protein [Brevibacillus daliensis]
MRSVTCYIKNGEDFTAFAEYHSTDIGEDGILARHLCTYFIKDRIQYKLLSNEMEEDREILIYEDQGTASHYQDERYNNGSGVLVEFRRLQSFSEPLLVHQMTCKNHTEVVRYLIKDYIYVAQLGHQLVDSSEIDEDRGVYVIYLDKDAS